MQVSQWYRTRAWLAWLASAVLTSALVVPFAWFVVVPLGTTGVCNGLAVLMAVFAVAAGARVVVRSCGPTRKAWALLATSSASWAVGDLVWMFHELAGHDPLRRSMMVGAFSVLSGVLSLAGLLTMPSAPPGRASRLKLVLDGMVVATALLLASWVLVIGRAYTASNLDDALRARAIAYPMLDVVTLTVVVLVTARARGRWVVPLLLVSAGLAVRSSVDTVLFGRALTDNTTSLPSVDLFWMLAFGLTGVAALYPVDTASGRLRADQRARRRAPVVRVLLPYVPVVGALVVSASAGLGPRPAATISMAGVLVVLLLARQAVTSLENARLAATLVHHAYHDALTGLANRALFGDRLREALQRTGPGRAPIVAVLLLDMDGFKAVNDSLGHAAGDRLLAVVASRLRAAAPSDAVVARLGGDEFGVLVESEDAGPGQGMRVASRLLEALTAPIPFEGRGVPVSASIGVAEWTRTGPPPEDLLRDADVAMYGAKAAGKSGIRMFEPGMRRVVMARAQLEAELRHALERDEFVLRFQPIVHLVTRAAYAAEVLVRWQHPRRGLLSPAAFVPMAAQAGLLDAIDRWVLGEACRAAARWQRLRPGFGISVNVAAGQFARTDLVGTVADALEASGLPPESLTLELTETALVEDAEATIARLSSLGGIGVKVAIDDFGTGYSALAYLRRLPVDAIKIDRSFVVGLGQDSEATALVEAILGLARTFGLRVVAEGVETERQLDRLRSMGCQRGQGFLFAKPLPADELTRLLGEAVEAPIGAAARPPIRFVDDSYADFVDLP